MAYTKSSEIADKQMPEKYISDRTKMIIAGFCRMFVEAGCAVGVTGYSPFVVGVAQRLTVELGIDAREESRLEDKVNAQ